VEKTKIKTIKLSDNDKLTNSTSQEFNVIKFIIKLFINTIVILLAAKIFKSISVDNFYYAMIAALLIGILNQFVKPFLKIITLPLTVLTFGLFYPFINVIILKIASLLMGNHFQVEGIIIPIIISYFITFMNYLLESLILGKTRR